MFTEEHMIEAERFKGLGPAYFCSRDVVERAMAGVQSTDFKPVLDGIVKQITDHVWEKMRDYLLSDTEMNLHGAMYHQVDDCVKALLTGERWALEHYVLGERYDHEAVRAAVAKHVPAELQAARVADLEEQVARLKKDLDFYRNK